MKLLLTVVNIQRVHFHFSFDSSHCDIVRGQNATLQRYNKMEFLGFTF